MEPPIKALLVPLDGSSVTERAVPVAARLAALTGAPLTLFHWNFDPSEARIVEHRLETLADRFDGPVEIEVVVSDDLVGAILNAAADRSATICMATHGRGGISRAILGSVAEEVVGRAGQPVLVVGPNVHVTRTGEAARILACVDGSARSERLIPTATALAQQVRAELELVSAIEPTEIEGLKPGAADLMDAGYLRRLAAKVELDAPPTYDVLHGDPRDAIVDHAAEDVELIVLGTHGRTGLQRVLVGSVAMGVAHDAPRPVLIVPTA